MLLQQEIYSHMIDDISRKLFLARLNASVLGDMSYITQLSDENKNLLEKAIAFRNRLCEKTSFKTVVFGAGFR